MLPDSHLLELFVTVTDFYGYERQVPYADPNPIHDMRHRHVLTFRYGGEEGRDDFDAASNGRPNTRSGVSRQPRNAIIAVL